jgi:hypothetical protein
MATGMIRESKSRSFSCIDRCLFLKRGSSLLKLALPRASLCFMS